MCGISAIVSSDPAKRALIAGMVEHQHPRGPEHEDVWLDDLCALGHNRLGLVDLSTAGDQPMLSPGWAITYNGEIYNHSALRRPDEHGTWNGSSDTETLLALISRHGVRATLPKLNGMFAFAAWNARERKLYMAVDRFGIKPLYIHHGNGFLACASSSAALLILKPQWHVDQQGLAQFFNIGGGPGVWQGIKKLEAGMLAVYDATTDTLTTERWYTPAFIADAADMIEDLVTDAMRAVAMADVPVGLFYSGGIDSSIVASQHRGAHAFHLGTAELNYAQQGAAHFGLQLHPIANDPDRVVEALIDVTYRTGEPTMAGHIPWLVSREAAKVCKAAISANGADELFFGYPRTATTPKGMPAMRAHLLRDEAYYTAPLGGKANWDWLGMGDDRFTYCARTRWMELMLYVQHDLNPMLDAASMCHSLEVRVPFLDHRLVEAALSLDHTAHGSKDILKRMLVATGLPRTFVDRPKLGFSMNKSSGTRLRYEQDALLLAQRMGLVMKSTLSGRDRSYLAAAAAGFAAWYGNWKHRIDPASLAPIASGQQSASKHAKARA